LGWYIILATIPGLIGGILFKDLLEQLFSDPGMAAIIRLFLTAGLLLIAERFGQRQRQLESLGWKDALWVGAAQVLSVFPGASRSGSTITGGMLRNFDRSSSARFAFLISIPIMLAAGAYEALDLRKVADLASFLPAVLVGFVVAAIVGYLAIRWLLNYLVRRPLYDFALYCAVLAVVALIALKL
jgi:undecaprenyl-diphosphatase